MRVCHVVYGHFPFDPRVRREVETLVRMGHEIDVIAMREAGEPREETVLGAHVHRVPWPVVRGGRVRYAFQYLIFLLVASTWLLALHTRRRFDIVHVHSLPDFQVLGALPEKVTGARLVLDLHEAMPEILVARFPSSGRGMLYALARGLETLSCEVADEVLVVNETIRTLIGARGTDARKLTVVMNSPDPSKLVVHDQERLRRELGLQGRRGIVYVGGINPERDLGVLVRAVARLRDEEARLVIYGYGDEKHRRQLERIASDEGLTDEFVLGPRLPQEDVFSYVALSEVGPITYARNPLTELAVPNKVFEYAAAGRPLVVADLRALRDLFQDAALFYEPGNADDLAKCIRQLLHDGALSRRLAERAGEILRACSWDEMARRLESVYERVSRRSD